MRVPPVQTLTVPVPGLTEPVQLLQHGNIDELAADFLTRLPTRAASDPGFYGALLWPGALLLAQLLAAGPCLRGSTVLELGAGTGLGTLVAAHRGARAIASDVYPLSLQLVKQSAAMADMSIEVVHFDAFSASPLPPADMVIGADVLYLSDLTSAIARRVAEARGRGSGVILTDSRRTHQMQLVRELESLGIAARFESHRVDWFDEVDRQTASLLHMSGGTPSKDTAE